MNGTTSTPINSYTMPVRSRSYRPKDHEIFTFQEILVRSKQPLSASSDAAIRLLLSTSTVDLAGLSEVRTYLKNGFENGHISSDYFSSLTIADLQALGAILLSSEWEGFKSSEENTYALLAVAPATLNSIATNIGAIETYINRRAIPLKEVLTALDDKHLSIAQIQKNLLETLSPYRLSCVDRIETATWMPRDVCRLVAQYSADLSLAGTPLIFDEKGGLMNPEVAEAIQQILTLPGHDPSVKAKIFHNFRNYENFLTQKNTADDHQKRELLRRNPGTYSIAQFRNEIDKNRESCLNKKAIYHKALNAIFAAVRKENGCIHLEGVRLNNVKFFMFQLNGTICTNAIFNNCNFFASNWTGSDFSYTKLSDSTLFRTTMCDTNFVGSVFENVRLSLITATGMRIDDPALKMLSVEKPASGDQPAFIELGGETDPHFSTNMKKEKSAEIVLRITTSSERCVIS